VIQDFFTSLILSLYPAALLYKALPFSSKNWIVFVILIVLVFISIKRLLQGGMYRSSALFSVLICLSGLYLLLNLYYQIPGLSNLYHLPAVIVGLTAFSYAYFISLALPFVILFFL
jgi:hypothetical protein